MHSAFFHYQLSDTDIKGTLFQRGHKKEGFIKTDVSREVDNSIFYILF